MALSSEESRDMLKMLQKSLRSAEKMIKNVSSDLEKAKLNTSLDDEIDVKMIDRFEEKLRKIKIRYSIKLRFVQHLEEKIEDHDIIITTEIKIAEKDTVIQMTKDEEPALEDEKPNCDDCLYNDINFGCAIGRKIIDGKCRFYT